MERASVRQLPKQGNYFCCLLSVEGSYSFVQAPYTLRSFVVDLASHGKDEVADNGAVKYPSYSAQEGPSHVLLSDRYNWGILRPNRLLSSGFLSQKSSSFSLRSLQVQNSKCSCDRKCSVSSRARSGTSGCVYCKSSSHSNSFLYKKNLDFISVNSRPA